MPHEPQETVRPTRKKSGKEKSVKNTSKVMSGAPDPIKEDSAVLLMDEDSDLYDDDEIVASLNRARDQMRQGKFIPKEDVLEDV